MCGVLSSLTEIPFCILSITQNIFIVDRGSLIDIKDTTCFLEEAIITKSFDHVNILSLLGVTIRNNRPYVILPFMELGDLKSYISQSHQVKHIIIHWLIMYWKL